ncbi:protein DBF4 homolog B [Spea bombifrons]|uniref:protein DBF4 homolog B n=1 Tax=Spea bombifrons TaxID=233779 RepID=UPI00234994A1|nr:protein DBF4 homolog B [Spea bombifrons]
MVEGKQKLRSFSFSGKLFYLDLPPNKQTQLLTKAVGRLGGVIESFLSRDVDYVVTGNKKVTGGGSARYQNAGGIESAHYSRGKQLLKKVIQNQDCSSVLTNACSWGVSILHVDAVLEYLEHLDCQPQNGISDRPIEGKADASVKPSRKVGKLRGLFLKIEDQSRKFRPLQCTFSSFPDISYASSDRSPFETVQTPNSTHKEKEPGEQEEDQGEKRPQTKRKGYCECCDETYEHLNEHLVSERHCRFALIPSHYKLIDDITANFAFDFVELPDGFSVDYEKGGNRNAPDDVSGPMEKEGQQLDPVQAPLESPRPEVAEAVSLGREELTGRPVPLGVEVAERLHVAGETRSNEISSGRKVMEGLGSVEMPPVNVAPELPADTAAHLHDNVPVDSKLPLPLAGVSGSLTAVNLSGNSSSPADLCKRALDDSAVDVPVRSHAGQANENVLLKVAEDVHEEKQAAVATEVALSDLITLVPKEKPLDTAEKSHTRMGSNLGPGGLTNFSQKAEKKASLSNDPLNTLCSGLSRGRRLLPVQPTPLPLPAETRTPGTSCHRTKRKHCGSPTSPPAKRPLDTGKASVSQAVAFPMWVEIWEYGREAPIPLWADWTKWDKGEGSDGLGLSCVIPMLTQEAVSSESDWDAQLLPHRPKSSQHAQQYGQLRTAQVNLDESWYGKRLCSVLACDRASSSTHCAPITPT